MYFSILNNSPLTLAPFEPGRVAPILGGWVLDPESGPAGWLKLIENRAKTLAMEVGLRKTVYLLEGFNQHKVYWALGSRTNQIGAQPGDEVAHQPTFQAGIMMGNRWIQHSHYVIADHDTPDVRAALAEVMAQSVPGMNALRRVLVKDAIEGRVAELMQYLPLCAGVVVHPCSVDAEITIRAGMLAQAGLSRGRSEQEP